MSCLLDWLDLDVHVEGDGGKVVQDDGLVNGVKRGQSSFCSLLHQHLP